VTRARVRTIHQRLQTCKRCGAVMTCEPVRDAAGARTFRMYCPRCEKPSALPAPYVLSDATLARLAGAERNPDVRAALAELQRRRALEAAP
jgi:hypothetical protein